MCLSYKHFDRWRQFPCVLSWTRRKWRHLSAYQLYCTQMSFIHRIICTISYGSELRMGWAGPTYFFDGRPCARAFNPWLRCLIKKIFTRYLGFISCVVINNIILMGISKRRFEPLRARFNYNLLSIDRSSNCPFIASTATQFPNESPDKRSKYRFDASTPSHSEPLQATLTHIWKRHMVFTLNLVLKSHLWCQNLENLWVKLSKYESPFWTEYMPVGAVQWADHDSIKRMS
jgi:hypothetical protein